MCMRLLNYCTNLVIIINLNQKLFKLSKNTHEMLYKMLHKNRKKLKLKHKKSPDKSGLLSKTFKKNYSLITLIVCIVSSTVMLTI